MIRRLSSGKGYPGGISDGWNGTTRRGKETGFNVLRVDLGIFKFHAKELGIFLVGKEEFSRVLSRRVKR